MPFGGALSLGISGASSLLGGLFGSKGAKKAASQVRDGQIQGANYVNEQKGTGQQSIQQGLTDLSGAVTQGQEGISTAGTDANNGLQASLEKQLALYLPYIQAGQTATGQLQQLSSATPDKFSFNPSDLSNDPGYKFTLQQGQDAIQRSAAAQGGLYSSGTLKSLAGYTTGTANQYFGDAYNRAASTFGLNRQVALDRVSTLQGLAGMGLTGTAGSSSAIGTNSGLQSANRTNAGKQIADLGIIGGQGSLQGHEASANLGADAGKTVSSLLAGAGAAQGAGTAGSTNNWLGSLGNLNNSILNFLNGRQQSGTGGGGSTGGNFNWSNPVGSAAVSDSQWD